MNILILALNVSIKARAGDAVHVRELALSLAKLGHQVSLVAEHSQKRVIELQLLQGISNFSKQIGGIK